ncbi:MAG: hypothetical protein ACE5G1_05325 [bacterium]
MLNRFYSVIAISVLAFFACQTQPKEDVASNGFDASKSDPQAVQVVDEMMAALGGQDNWQKVRFLSYHWIVEVDGNTRSDFRHDWDRYTNNYRVEGTNRDGQHFVIVFNTQSKEGDVFLDGTKVTVDSTRAQWLERAYGRYINDSYWLLMPYKLKDPGVILSYEGEKEVDGDNYDVVKVTFASVGLTPGDTYWAYIGKSDRLMHKWEYKLQGWPADRQPSSAWWREWQDVGNIKLAMSKEFDGRPARIYFKDVIASMDVDEGIFELTSKTF